MSIIYCERHDLRWDSDFKGECPMCESEPTADEEIKPYGPTVYEAAVAFLADGGTPRNLPRALGIGQIVADDVFARLEREGIVGPPRKDGTREVLK